MSIKPVMELFLSVRAQTVSDSLILKSLSCKSFHIAQKFSWDGTDSAGRCPDLQVSPPYRIGLLSSSFSFPLFFSQDVAAFYTLEVLRDLLGPNPILLGGESQGTPWWSCQLIAGPLLMAVAATQGANCTSGAILGFSILLKDTSTCSSVPPQGGPGIWTSDHQLYPLSYSRPGLLSPQSEIKFCVFKQRVQQSWNDFTPTC